MESSEAEAIADLAALAKAAREAQPKTQEKPISDLLKPVPQPATPERLEAIQREERRRAEYRIRQAWNELVKHRGERYRDCLLANFDCGLDEQTEAVGMLRDYCESVRERAKKCEGIVLFGPRGTGKDHLLMAVARAAIGAGMSVGWQNGMDLFGDVRDAMSNGSDERRIVSDLVRPDVLYLSDPLPVVTTAQSSGKANGALTEFQASMLFRILDGRYSRNRPTWVTVNVQSGKELDERLGPQNADRLRDNALAIYCNWPSYRKAKQQ